MPARYEIEDRRVVPIVPEPGSEGVVEQLPLIAYLQAPGQGLGPASV